LIAPKVKTTPATTARTVSHFDTTGDIMELELKPVMRRAVATVLLAAAAVAPTVTAASAHAPQRSATVAQYSGAGATTLSPMTLGKAVAMTPPQLAAERSNVLHAAVGGNNSSQATLSSKNWSGLATSGSFQGVAGEWKVPTVQATAKNKYSCAWVGLDGASGSSLIQTGTESDSYNGRTRYYAWLEMLPQSQSVITYTNGSAVPVAPGDSMWAYIYRTGTGNTWAIHLQDLSRGWSLSTTKSYASPGASVEWVQEATKVNGVIAPPPAFSRVGFSNLEVMDAGRWYYTSMTASSKVFMVQNGVRYATPSAPTATAPQSFSVSYG
jgi:hypothetical protein